MEPELVDWNQCAFSRDAAVFVNVVEGVSVVSEWGPTSEVVGGEDSKDWGEHPRPSGALVRQSCETLVQVQLKRQTLHRHLHPYRTQHHLLKLVAGGSSGGRWWIGVKWEDEDEVG